VAQRAADYKQLGDVVVCDAIPKTPAGKILRRVLRAQDAEGRRRFL
jgi:acyl-coenzyme A synthetase/AMP-(fatty) acid ligase